MIQGLIHKILSGGAKPRLRALRRGCARPEPEGVYPPGGLSLPLGGLGASPRKFSKFTQQMVHSGAL